MSQYIIINLTYLFLLCYYTCHSKSRLKMYPRKYYNCCKSFTTVVKIEIKISYPYKPIPEQGLEYFKQKQSMKFLKK